MVASMGFEKCLMRCTHYYSTTENSFSPSCLAKPLAATNPDTILLCLSKLSRSSNHMSYSFSDRFLSLNSMYLRFLCLFMTREPISPWNEIPFSGCLIHSQLKDILVASTFVWTELPPICVLAFVQAHFKFTWVNTKDCTGAALCSKTTFNFTRSHLTGFPCGCTTVHSHRRVGVPAASHAHYPWVVYFGLFPKD